MACPVSLFNSLFSKNSHIKLGSYAQNEIKVSVKISFVVTCHKPVLSLSDLRKHCPEDVRPKHAGCVYPVGHQCFGWLPYHDHGVDLRLGQRCQKAHSGEFKTACQAIFRPRPRERVVKQNVRIKHCVYMGENM